MEYSTLDISQDLSDQGFEDREYDLIIANNVFRTAKPLRATLANCKKLLAQDGKLLLRELSPSSGSINYILGAQPGWWDAEAEAEAEADSSTSDPCFSTRQWERELMAAGIDRIEGVAANSTGAPWLITTVLASQAPKQVPLRRVAMLCGDRNAKEVSTFVHEFKEAGYAVTVCTLDEQPLRTWI